MSDKPASVSAALEPKISVVQKKKRTTSEDSKMANNGQSSPIPSISAATGAGPTANDMGLHLNRGTVRGFGTLFRRSEKPILDVASGTLHATTKRSKGRTGVARAFASPSSDSGTESIDSSDGGDDLDESDSDSDTVSIYSTTHGKAAKPVQVFVHWNSAWSTIRLTCMSTVSDAIKAMLVEVTHSAGTEADDPSLYRLCKLDRNSPGQRTWLNPGQTLLQLKISDGDELRLRLVSHNEKMVLTIPPSSTKHTFEYNFDLTIKDAVANLLKDHLPTEEGRYGLYYPRFGIWLDDTKALFQYDIVQEIPVELRALAAEFLMRIQVPEFDTKFGIKVLPTLRVSDVTAMIHYNLNNRKLVLGHPGGRYGLYIPSSSRWMEEIKTLDQYEAVKTEDIHYKLQYQTFTVTSSDGAIQKFIVGSTTLVEHVLEMLSVNSTNSFEDTFGLYTYYGERLKDKDSIWTILKDMGIEQDVIYYRPLAQKICVCTSIDAEGHVEMDVDFSKPLKELLPFFCRRFGVRMVECGGCKDENGGVLDSEKSLNASRVSHASTIMIIKKPPSSILESPVSAVSAHSAASAVSTLVDGGASDLNIWEEREGNDMLQYIMNNQDPPIPVVSAGTLNKLVVQLTNEKGEGSTQYLDFVKAFLLTYQSFTNAFVLLRKLIERYHVPRQGAMTQREFEKFRLTVQLRVCNVFLQWTRKYTSDFMDPKNGDALIAEMTRFTETVLATDHPTMAKQIRKSITKLKEGPEALTVTLTKMMEAPPPSKPPKQGRDGVVHIFAYPAEEIARQLTIIEFSLYYNIRPSELLNQAWTKRDANVRAPGILALTRRFNAVACWVAKTLLDLKSVKARARRLHRLIEIATQLHALNNFSTLMAFIAGLNKAAIMRLKYTFKELSSSSRKKLADLEKLMTAENSYKAYRAALHTVNPPCIPYIGVYLIDLTYMEDGNPNMVDNLINFTKRTMISTVIRELQQYQSSPVNFRIVDELARLLNAFPDATDTFEKLLYELSLKREPRDQTPK
ncbi:hypothetical protein SmJEL517_g05330 [Synchytrium microbalum]|uniref:Ras-GEF domain-containing protein n=1 Tax=Synchytrium microbalum TaxID=1806994 RepID=A0A507BLV9_9FUNG|nr:uncharacterized protein SmJEL517_g05330 [Synchytrium microbalum]TPX31310.1 hypothetical protein SmJEL517_g05330 [Synchytrium microbalum]